MPDKKTKEEIIPEEKVVKIPKPKIPKSVSVSSDDALRKAGVPESEIR